MRMGFSVVFYIGAAFYVVALLFFLMRTRVGKNTESVQPAA